MEQCGKECSWCDDTNCMFHPENLPADEQGKVYYETEEDARLQAERKN